MNSQLAILSYSFLGIPGRPLPIHTLFSRVFDPCLGRSRLSSAEAASEGAVMARVEEAAIAPAAARGLVMAGRVGRLAVEGINCPKFD